MLIVSTKYKIIKKLKTSKIELNFEEKWYEGINNYIC